MSSCPSWRRGVAAAMGPGVDYVSVTSVTYTLQVTLYKSIQGVYNVADVTDVTYVTDVTATRPGHGLGMGSLTMGWSPAGKKDLHALQQCIRGRDELLRAACAPMVWQWRYAMVVAVSSDGAM